MQRKADEPRGDQRQAAGKKSVNDDAGEQNEDRQNPVPDADEVFGEVIRRGKTDLRKQHERRGDANVRRIENVLRAAFTTGARKITFDPMASAVANTNGQSRSLG